MDSGYGLPTDSNEKQYILLAFIWKVPVGLQLRARDLQR